MRKRWAPSALVACLVLVVTAMCRGMEAKRSHAVAVERRPAANNSAIGVAAVDLRRCRDKKMDVCGYLVRAQQNHSSVDDDKRVVPTGSNPLHNR
ncbi:unnamed protein product [Musa hybrid cultivar]